MAAMRPFRLSLFGLLGDLGFTKAKSCAEILIHKEQGDFINPEIIAMVEFDWDIFVEEKKKELRGESWTYKEKGMAFINGEFLGGPEVFLEWAADNYNYKDYRPDPLLQTLGEEQYVEHMNTNKREYVYMDVNIDSRPAGRLLIQLFTDTVPKTCENFKCLCTGEKGVSEHNELESYDLHYKGHLFHRIVPNGWIQGGDIWSDRGNGGESINGEHFEDENFAIKHNMRGILGMANKGRHTNGSQFYITLQPTPWMDTNYVAFGRVVEGTNTLKAMESVETIMERPAKDIRIVDCGATSFSY